MENVELHIFGSNFPKEFENLSEIKGIKNKGLMKDLKQLGKYKYMLAPLFFGAGVKGKICDSWFEHTPVITTPIGAEGLFLEQYDNFYD